MKVKEILEIWKSVFGNWRYSLLGISVIFLFYSLNVTIANFSTIVSFYKNSGFFSSAEFFWILILGFKETIEFHSFVSLIIISVLLGMLVSLIAYRTNLVKVTSGKIGVLGTLGIFLGILAPGCAACGIGILSALGFGAAAITFLPFEGLELSWLAIGILGFSVYKISKDIKKGIICEI